MKPKTVAETAVEDHVYKVFPNDLNSNGTVFGGLVMSILDRVASVVSERHSQKLCVTASVDSMHFLAPARRGDILLFQASLNRSWRTSMELWIKVTAENYHSRETHHMLSAYFTFVALDEKGKPTPVPEVIPETKIQKRRFEEANIRRENRKRDAKACQERRTAHIHSS